MGPPRTAQAETIVYCTYPYSPGTSAVGAFKSTGATINANFVTGLAGFGGIVQSGNILYVTSVVVSSNGESSQNVVATYNATTGALINPSFVAYPVNVEFQPAGMCISDGYLYVVATAQNAISKFDATTGEGNPYFIQNQSNNGLNGSYAIAIKGKIIYVTNNYLNPNGYYYISEYNADTGKLINANFIQVTTSGELYGLAVKDNHLFVTQYGGSSSVAEYNATSGAVINPNFIPLPETWGIAVSGNTLFVASYNQAVVYEYNATTGAQLSHSIAVPENVAVNLAVQAVIK